MVLAPSSRKLIVMPKNYEEGALQMPMTGVVGDLISFLVAQIDRFVGTGSKINTYGIERNLCEIFFAYKLMSK